MPIELAAIDSTATPFGEIVLRLFAAMACGFVIGIDRESRSKPAGLRTHMLVSVAAAAFTLLTFELTVLVLQAVPTGSLAGAQVTHEIEASLRPDPLRLMEAIVAGVGFLGGGAIFRARGEIEGLTTGAGIWVAGSIGLACGAGFYLLAGFVTILCVLIVTVLGLFKRKIIRPERHRE